MHIVRAGLGPGVGRTTKTNTTAHSQTFLFARYRTRKLPCKLVINVYSKYGFTSGDGAASKHEFGVVGGTHLKVFSVHRHDSIPMIKSMFSFEKMLPEIVRFGAIGASVSRSFAGGRPLKSKVSVMCVPHHPYKLRETMSIIFLLQKILCTRHFEKLTWHGNSFRVRTLRDKVLHMSFFGCSEHKMF